MLPYDGKINEYNQINQELQNITLLDLIKVFNERGSFNSQHENDTNKLLDIIAKHFDYFDRYDMLNVNQYNTNVFKGINHVYEVLDTLAQMYGYYDHMEFISHNKNRLEEDAKLRATLTEPVDINKDNETLLRIDMRGNVWLKGQIENNPTKIGREILNIANKYRDNFVIETVSEYLNLHTVKKEENEFDTLPF